MLVISLTAGGVTAWGQIDCINDCIEELADCLNQGGSPQCEDDYDACVEACLIDPY